ncbi:MAG: cytochrome c3 family protein [Planctomycetota bacterium]
MHKSIAFFIVAAAASWLGGLTLAAVQPEPVVQPIDFNHKVHVKRVDCRECHFLCENNRDEDGELDCDDCEDADTPFCPEHAKCPDHKLPGFPTVRDCLRCHEDDLLELRDSAPGEDEPADHRKRVLLDYVTFDEFDEPRIHKEIPWKRVTEITTSNVYFSHRTHAILQKLPCEGCHGAVGDTEHPPAHPSITGRMDWCLECHRETGASEESALTQCCSCHR